MGHGKSACPGRFFASSEVKILFAHLLLNYEWKAVGKVPQGGVIKQFEPSLDPVVAFRAKNSAGFV
jgi:cytochrome P450